MEGSDQRLDWVKGPAAGAQPVFLHRCLD